MTFRQVFFFSDFLKKKRKRKKVMRWAVCLRRRDTRLSTGITSFSNGVLIMDPRAGDSPSTLNSQSNPAGYFKFGTPQEIHGLQSRNHRTLTQRKASYQLFISGKARGTGTPYGTVGLRCPSLFRQQFCKIRKKYINRVLMTECLGSWPTGASDYST